MAWKNYTKYLIIGFIIGFLCVSIGSYAIDVISDYIPNFKDESVSLLNNQLRNIRQVLIDHEARIVALEP